MRALVFLEWCYARHNVAAILRSPGRLVLWSVYALSLMLFAIARFSRSQPHGSHAPLGLAPGAAISAGGTFLLFSGLAIATAAAGRVATFRSPSEAGLMSNAGLAPLTIALWLQLRKIAAGWTRMLGGFLYAFLVFVPSHAGPLATGRAFAATIVMLGIPLAAGLPAFLLARGRAKAPVYAFGGLLATVGFAYAVAGASGPGMWEPVLQVTHFDPALIVRATLLSQPLAFAVPLVVLATFVLVVALRGNDALPELYAAANATLARVRRARSGITAPDRNLPASGTQSARVPYGAGAIVWKDWVAIRRNRAAFRLWIAGGLLWIVCGAGAAAVTLRQGDPTPLSTFAVAVGLVIIFWAPFSAATGLAGDLSKPLFWLSTASLQTRLGVWAFARAWRGGAALGCGAGAALLVLGQPTMAALCIPFAASAYWSLNALGIGLYAVIPNPLDARGPIALLRFVASLAYLLPAALLGLAAALAHAGLPVAIAAFVLGLALQGWLVIELVALRFTEFGASLATISRAS